MHIAIQGQRLGLLHLESQKAWPEWGTCPSLLPRIGAERGTAGDSRGHPRSRGHRSTGPRCRGWSDIWHAWCSIRLLGSGHIDLYSCLRAPHRIGRRDRCRRRGSRIRETSKWRQDRVTIFRNQTKKITYFLESSRNSIYIYPQCIIMYISNVYMYISLCIQWVCYIFLCNFYSVVYSRCRAKKTYVSSAVSPCSITHRMWRRPLRGHVAGGHRSMDPWRVV